MLSVFDLAALFFVLVAIVGLVNHRWVRMPHSVGLVVFSVLGVLGLKAADALTPGFSIAAKAEAIVRGIDFNAVVMNGMLGFLLFAGALPIDLGDLSKRKWPIAVMATVGVVLSTAVIGVLCWSTWGVLGIAVPFVVCLVFGALISPTDPIAVLAIMKTVRVPKSIEIKVAGESLFNDGVAIVVFTTLLAVAATAMGLPGDAPTPSDVAVLFLREAVGGVVLGGALGYVAFVLMRSIDEHAIEIMITLALVTAIMSLGRLLHVSGPIGVVVAGLLIGNHGSRFAMSEHTRVALFTFWGVLDEVLNSILFLLLGMEIMIIAFDATNLTAAAVAIPVVLLARFLAVTASVATAQLFRQRFSEGAIRILTWGGLRGALSVALVLSLPASPYKDTLVVVTYVVCVFSIVAQGLTMKSLINRVVPPGALGSEGAAKADAH